MPITPAAIPSNFNNLLIKQGCFDNDVMSQVNALFQAQDVLVATTSNAALGFAAFNAAAAVTLLPSTTPAGLYEVNIYGVVTTTFVTNTTWNFSLGFTDDAAAQSPIVLTSSTLTAGTGVFAAYTFRSNGTAAITYTPGKTGSAATAGVVAFSLAVQRLL
jgi:hypothetical protein